MFLTTCRIACSLIKIFRMPVKNKQPWSYSLNYGLFLIKNQLHFVLIYHQFSNNFTLFDLHVCVIMQRKNTKRKSEKKKNNYTTAVDAFCNYPCSCRLSCLHQPFAENLLDLWRKLEILNASMNRDHQLWQFHLPFFNHQVQQLIQIAIIRKSNILERKIMSKINIF